MIEYLDTATKTTFHQIVYGFVIVFAIALFINGVEKNYGHILLDGLEASTTTSCFPDVSAMRLDGLLAALFLAWVWIGLRCSISTLTILCASRSR